MAEKGINEFVGPGVEGYPDRDVPLGEQSVAVTEKSRWERIWPALACGSGKCSGVSIEICTK
jgi:hypothetical protein